MDNAFKLKVYKLQLFTPEAQEMIDSILRVVEFLKKQKIGEEFGLVTLLPKGMKRGPFPSKIPLFRQFAQKFEEVLFFT